MESALIVSKSEKAIHFFSGVLKQDQYEDIIILTSGSEARQLLADRDFDLCIVDAPLQDESGAQLAVSVSEDCMCQVLLVVRAEYFDEITDKVEDYGIITVSKPISRTLLWNALKMARAASMRMGRMRKENSKLIQKMDDLKVINRAKCLLISYLNMTEEEAHKYVEKQAMDTRSSKRQVAEKILKTYKN